MIIKTLRIIININNIIIDNNYKIINYSTIININTRLILTQTMGKSLDDSCDDLQRILLGSTESTLAKRSNNSHVENRHKISQLISIRDD